MIRRVAACLGVVLGFCGLAAGARADAPGTVHTFAPVGAPGFPALPHVVGQNVFEGTLVDNKLLTETIRKPGTRAESVLDGLFAKAAIVVEAEGDRDFYSSAAEQTMSTQATLASIADARLSACAGSAPLSHSTTLPSAK